MKALAAIPDLFFRSKVFAVAKELGTPLAMVSRGQAILDRARAERPDVLLVDLAAADLRPMESIAALKADPELRAARVVGYYHHTSPTLAEEAARAGCDQVMTRGEFTRRLPQLLAGL